MISVTACTHLTHKRNCITLWLHTQNFSVDLFSKSNLTITLTFILCWNITTNLELKEFWFRRWFRIQSGYMNKLFDIVFFSCSRYRLSSSYQTIFHWEISKINTATVNSYYLHKLGFQRVTTDFTFGKCKYCIASKIAICFVQLLYRAIFF